MFDMIPFDRRDRNMLRAWDDFEKNFFGDWSGMMTGFRTDIIDKGDKYVLEAELPGFEKGDIHIDLDGDMLTIRAEHNSEEEKKHHKYVRQERYTGACQRSFYVGEGVKQERSYSSYSRSFRISDVKPDGISAAYKNGVLELVMPKREGALPSGRSIEIQ